MRILPLILALAVVTITAPASAQPTDLDDVGNALATWTGWPRESADDWAAAITTNCGSRTECITVAALAFEESRFVQWVVDYSCNDAAWRREHGKDKVCDYGRAVGPWQILDAHELVGASPQDNAAAAVALYRRNPRAWTTWRSAASRAQWWLARHP